MAITSEDLAHFSPAMQKQILGKVKAEDAARLQKQAKPRKSKYNNVKVDRGQLKFDSQKEARRFDELMLRQQAGEIRNLRLQTDFTLQEAYTTTEGVRVRSIVYRADFSYDEKQGDGWVSIVEDVKSKATKTRVYSMKRKMMADRFGVVIREV